MGVHISEYFFPFLDALIHLSLSSIHICILKISVTQFYHLQVILSLHHTTIMQYLLVQLSNLHQQLYRFLPIIINYIILIHSEVRHHQPSISFLNRRLRLFLLVFLSSLATLLSLLLIHKHKLLLLTLINLLSLLLLR